MRPVRTSLLLFAPVVVVLSWLPAACGQAAEPPDRAPGGSVPAATGPGGTGAGPAGATSVEGVAAAVVGSAEADAVARITKAGFTWRVVARDGERFVVTMDYSDTRINLELAGGTVVGATVG